MNYKLSNSAGRSTVLSGIKKLSPFLTGEKNNVLIAFFALVVNSAANLIGPMMIGYTIDHFIQAKNYHGIFILSGILLVIYGLGLVASYTQTIRMGGVGRRLLFNMRSAVFKKLQELPVAFFNQNKTGDLISRINNDTDKLNQFFAQALMQFIGNFFMMIGAGIFLLSLNVQLASAAMLPAGGVFIITRLISSWVKRKNTMSLQSLGNMSSEIQESLENFRVIVAFNRLDYFRKKFNEANEKNYSASVGAGIANNIFIPIYGLAANIAQLLVLGYGIHLITTGNFTIGLLISFLLYINNFYMPLRHIGALWSSLQLALAAPP
jgi:ATP-binding cassette subfamily B protein